VKNKGTKPTKEFWEVQALITMARCGHMA
jgi:hypothetical protein